MKSLSQKQIDAKAFSDRWKDRGDEKQDSHTFWIELLRDVLGMDDYLKQMSYEMPVKQSGKKHDKYIDIYMKDVGLLIEQKSHSVDNLDEAFEQAKGYIGSMKSSDKVRYVIVSNFKSFRIYDRDKDPADPTVVIKLEDLYKQIYQFNFIIDPKFGMLPYEAQISSNAGALIRNVYDSLAKYGVSEHELNLFCTRLMFCFFAEDAGLFPQKKQFTSYLHRCGNGMVRDAVKQVFKTIDIPEKVREDGTNQWLVEFPYVNGGLFAQGDLPIVPECDAEAFDILLNEEYECFDWSSISPAIFGAIFESTLKAAARKENGMHYTSVENIHKVIDPLFLNDLKAELEAIQTGKMSEVKRNNALADFQNKLAHLTFLDPACGSGNFLTETYVCLRRLENKVIKTLYKTDQGYFGKEVAPIKVSINQFYGIEKEDFAATVAKTALWIAEFQMRKETEEIILLTDEYLPLHTAAHIAVGNSLRMDWQELVPNVSYIIGNPPFMGVWQRTKEQSSDLQFVLGKGKVGKLDYVSCWFKRATEYMLVSPQTQTAFLSTNSISQGESASLWNRLEKEGAVINFAWQTFKWHNSADNSAFVFCVVIGFGIGDNGKQKHLFIANRDGSFTDTIVAHINAYLESTSRAKTVKRKTPLQKSVKQLTKGCVLADGEAFSFTTKEKLEFIAKEPQSAQYFKRLYGGEELINGEERWCLYLAKCPEEQRVKMPACEKVLARVKHYRKYESKNKAIQNMAECPEKLYFENIPACTGLGIAETSSGKRKYTPMRFLGEDVMFTHKLYFLPKATLYDFGILTSFVHMVWLHTVGGNYGGSCCYSIGNVYNNFPWPTVSEAQREAIEKTAQAILDARAKHSTMTLAQMYKDISMPTDLREAHKANDNAVLKAYGLPANTEDPKVIYERLSDLYDQIVKNN